MKDSEKIVLDLCGGTGAWSKLYSENGYKVYNITSPIFDVRKHFFNYKEDELIFVKNSGMTLSIPINKVWGILAAPPCTMFSIARTNAKYPRDLKEGMELVIACLDIIWGCQYKVNSNTQKSSNLKFWALENPSGLLKWFLGKPPFQFNPFEFGDNYKKITSVWGNFNYPIKNPIKTNKEKFDELKMSELKSLANDIVWRNQNNRKELRAITPSGFAKAFFEANK